jgi:hypothetical protein
MNSCRNSRSWDEPLLHSLGTDSFDNNQLKKFREKKVELTERKTQCRYCKRSDRYFPPHGGPGPRIYISQEQGGPVIPRVEAGSNTSTVALRVVEGNKKGSFKPETVKYMVASPTGLGPENDWAGEGQQQL